MQAADAAAAEISGRLGRFGWRRAGRRQTRPTAWTRSAGAARRSAEKDLAKLAQLKAELAEAEADEERAATPSWPTSKPKRSAGTGAPGHGRAQRGDGSPP